MRPLTPLIALALGCSPTLELTAPLDAAPSDARAQDAEPDAGALDWAPSTDGWRPDARFPADLSAPPDAEPPDSAPVDAAPDLQPPDLGLGPALVEQGPASPGTHDGTHWTAAGLTLIEGRDAGEFVSDPLPAPHLRRWARLRWAPALPYGHALADAGQPLLDFPDGVVGQDGLQLLLHLDDPSPWDAGPYGLTVQAEGGGETAGVFRDAWHLPGADQLIVPTRAVEFGVGDFTWAAFARMAPCDGLNGVLLGGEGPVRNAAHGWLGCQADAPCPGVGLGGTFRASNGARTDACAGALPGDDRWHHVAVVKARDALRFYVDGALSAALDAAWGGGGFDLSGFFTVGAFEGRYPLTASVDELALWRRALSDRELAAMAGRGLARAEVWARGCPAVDACEQAGPFLQLGEHGGGAGWWVDALPPPTAVLQYKVVLRRTAGAAPVIRHLQLEAD